MVKILSVMQNYSQVKTGKQNNLRYLVELFIKMINFAILQTYKDL